MQGVSCLLLTRHFSEAVVESGWESSLTRIELQRMQVVGDVVKCLENHCLEKLASLPCKNDNNTHFQQA
jgi:hypothetical protein